MLTLCLAASIFRFLKLPIELRYKIYELAVIGEDPFHPLNYRKRQNLALGLIRTCRQVHEESMRFFYKNNFQIIDDCKKLSERQALMGNLREVTFSWWGYATKDRFTFDFLGRCSQLKTLHLLLTSHCINASNYHRRQKLHQDDDSVKRFCKTNGFDSLVQIRGLSRVHVRPNDGMHAPNNLPKTDLDAFETFLNGLLTLPKEPVKEVVSEKTIRTSQKLISIQESTPKKVKARKSTKRTKRSHIYFDSDDDYF